MTRKIVFLSLGLVMAAHAGAAPIYRCGTDGKTYSQVPCPEGTIVEATDPRTAAQRAEARRFTEAERRRASELERERQAAEKAAAKEAPGATAIGAATAPKAASAPAGRKKKAGQDKAADKDFTAVVPKAAAPAR